MLNGGYNAAERYLEQQWPRATQEGLVSGTPAGVLRRVLSRRVGNEAHDLVAATAALERILKAAGLNSLLAFQLAYDRVFQVKFARLYARAREHGWSPSTWATRVRSLLAQFGASGGVLGSLAQVWLFSGLVAPWYDQARREVIDDPTVAALTPYLVHKTRDDGRVRPNHLLLHNFVAAKSARAWVLYLLPPHGWRCRCRPVELPWWLARKLNYRGTFPNGDGQLQEFIAAGGQDPGFPRERFVFGLAA